MSETNDSSALAPAVVKIVHNHDIFTKSRFIVALQKKYPLFTAKQLVAIVSSQFYMIQLYTKKNPIVPSATQAIHLDKLGTFYTSGTKAKKRGGDAGGGAGDEGGGGTTPRLEVDTVSDDKGGDEAGTERPAANVPGDLPDVP